MAKNKGPRISEDEVSTMIQNYLSSSLGYQAGELTNTRAKALDYYNGTPFGHTDLTNAEFAAQGVNRSQAQSKDVFDVVEWAVPQLIKPFMSNTDQIIRFRPNSPKEEEIAEQQTDFINYNFFYENNGFMVLQQALRDAAQLKNCYVECRWEEKKEISNVSYDDITDVDFIELLQDPELELIKDEVESEDYIDPSGQTIKILTHDCTFKRTHTSEQIVYYTWPPEDFFVSARQRDVDLANAEFCAIRMYTTSSHLLALGFSEDKIQSLPSQSVRIQNPIQISRYYYPEEQMALLNVNDNINQSMRPIECYRVFLRYDSDGDGIAEIHEIYYSNRMVLSDEIVDKIPIFSGTLLVQPHKHYGLSLADLSMQTQEIKTILLQLALDNFYYHNIPITAVDTTRVQNIDDVLYRQPGSTIPVEGDPNSVLTQFPPVFTASSTLEIMQYLDDTLQARTGVGRMTAGLDKDLLNNNKGDKTAQMVMSAAQERLGFMAKNIAETLLRPMFRYAAELFVKYQREPKMFKLNDRYVEIDPKVWDLSLDISIDVGLGSGDRDKELAGMAMVLQNYQMLYQAGAFGTLFNQKNVYKTLTDMAKLSGIKYPNLYYQDPDSEEAQAFIQQQQQSQKQDPQTMLIQLQAQIEQQRIELQKQKQQMDAILKSKELELKTLSEARQMHDSLEKNANTRTDLELKYRTNVPGALT